MISLKTTGQNVTVRPLRMHVISCGSLGGGGGVLPYMTYSGDVLLTGYGFSLSVLNRVRVCILSFVQNRDLNWRVLSYSGLVF